MGENRRDYKRHVKRLRMRFLDQGVWRSCFTANISVSGMFVESLWIPKESKIEIEVFLDEETPTKVVGQPVRGARVPPQLLRVAKGGFAVRLVQADPRWYEYCLALGK
jgi:hypothetical protein